MTGARGKRRMLLKYEQSLAMVLKLRLKLE